MGGIGSTLKALRSFGFLTLRAWSAFLEGWRIPRGADSAKGLKELMRNGTFRLFDGDQLAENSFDHDHSDVFDQGCNGSIGQGVARL